MNNIIVNESSSEIRAIARNALRGNWPQVVLGYLVYYLMVTTVPNLLDLLIPGSTINYYNEILGSNIGISYVASLYNLFLTGAFLAGLSSFFLAFFRRKDINPGYVFNGFEYFIKSLGLMLVIDIFTMLWTMLFIVPGIIAAIRYSQAFFILADNPQKGVMECLNESKFLMNGNKSKFFCLNLSFFGWLFVASLIMFWVPMPDGILSVILDVIVSLPYMVATTYLYTAQTAFYELVTGTLVAKPKMDFNEDDYHFTN